MLLVDVVIFLKNGLINRRPTLPVRPLKLTDWTYSGARLAYILYSIIFALFLFLYQVFGLCVKFPYILFLFQESFGGYAKNFDDFSRFKPIFHRNKPILTIIWHQ